MTIDSPPASHNEDLDKDDRLDKWRVTVWVLALLLLGVAVWALVAQTNASDKQASSEASQKFTLAQQVAAACAIKEQADDLGGLCASATQIVKEGPAGSPGIQGPPGETGPVGPLGPKGEDGTDGTNGTSGTNGVAGTDGAVGATGAEGDPGPAGPPGPVGDTGAVGATGATGPSGANGADGATGATGATGPAAFPFSFTFSAQNGTYDCTITAQDAIANCTTSK